MEKVDNMKYKIWVYVVCWNEIDVLPYVIDYWKQYAEKVVVYDNGSDDGTLELLSKYHWIEVRRFESGGLDDTENMKIKNECWKEARGKADFVVVSDFDECLFSPVLEEELDYMKENEFTICGPDQYALCDDHFPEYTEGKFLHEILTRVYHQKSNHSFDVTGKIMLFNPNAVIEMNYGPGCHTCSPTGNIKLYDRNRLFCLHTQKGFGIDYRISRIRILEKRLSTNNKRKGLGVHYTFNDEKIRKEYEHKISISKNILDVLKEINK